MRKFAFLSVAPTTAEQINLASAWGVELVHFPSGHLPEDFAGVVAITPAAALLSYRAGYAVGVFTPSFLIFEAVVQEEG